MTTSVLRTTLVLGLLASTGPFAIDMYLPALPAIEQDFSVDVAGVQVTLTAFFITFGLAQLFYGPLSDQLGRKPPLYIGLSVFIIGSIGCALASTIHWLLVARAVQGLGAAAVMVMPRAVVRDQYTGPQATRMMASIMLVISVAPLLAPLIGSLLIAVAHWRIIFLVLALIATISLFLTAWVLPETHPPADRTRVNLKSFARDSLFLLGNSHFLLLTFIGGFSMASFFVFISSASFVYTGQYQLTPIEFSLAFAFNAIGFFGASQMAATLGERVGMMRLISLALACFLSFTSVLLAFCLLDLAPLYVVMIGLFLSYACLGLVMPTAMVLALDPFGKMAGLASSLGGTLQMVCGGLAIASASPFFDSTVTPMVTAITLCGLCAFLLSRKALSLSRVVPPQQLLV